MKVIFKYDLNKDVTNFLKSTKSKNNKKLTQLASEYVNRHGDDFNHETVSAFIARYQKEHSVDPENIKNKIESKWQGIQGDFFNKTEEIFNTNFKKDFITCYLTTETRCTYNIQENYFYTTMQYPDKANWLIMHEILHFYTWQEYKSKLTKLGIDDKEYNEIKEALTVLLNSEYKDLMGAEIDKGYPQHQELRAEITNWWKNYRDLDLVIEKVVKYIKK